MHYTTVHVYIHTNIFSICLLRHYNSFLICLKTHLLFTFYVFWTVQICSIVLLLMVMVGGGGDYRIFTHKKAFSDITSRNAFLHYYTVCVDLLFFRNKNDADWPLYGNTEHVRWHLIIVLLCYSPDCPGKSI